MLLRWEGTYPREGICLDELEDRLKRCRVKACVFTLNFSNPLAYDYGVLRQSWFYHAFVGISLPLAILAVRGWRRFGIPRTVAVLAILALTVPGMAFMVQQLRKLERSLRDLHGIEATLKEQLERDVANEEYETAARLRDELRQRQ